MEFSVSQVGHKETRRLLVSLICLPFHLLLLLLFLSLASLSSSSYRLPPVVMSPVVSLQWTEGAPTLSQRERKEGKQ